MPAATARYMRDMLFAANINSSNSDGALCDTWPATGFMWVIGTFARTAPFFVTEAYPMRRTRNLATDNLILDCVGLPASIGDGRSATRIRVTRQYLPSEFHNALTNVRHLGWLLAHLGTYKDLDDQQQQPGRGVALSASTRVSFQQRHTTAKQQLQPLERMFAPLAQSRSIDGTVESVAAVTRKTPLRPGVVCQHVYAQLSAATAAHTWSRELDAVGELASPMAWISAEEPSFAELALGVDLWQQLRTLNAEALASLSLALTERRIGCELFFLAAYEPAYLRPLLASSGQHNAAAPTAEREFIRAVPLQLLTNGTPDENGLAPTHQALHDLRLVLINAHALCSALCDMLVQRGKTCATLSILAHRCGLIPNYPSDDRLFRPLEHFVINHPQATTWTNALDLLLGKPVLSGRYTLARPVLKWVHEKANVVQLAFVADHTATLCQQLRPFLDGTHQQQQQQLTNGAAPRVKRHASTGDVFTRSFASVESDFAAAAQASNVAQYDILGAELVTALRTPGKCIVCKPYLGEPPLNWLAFIASAANAVVDGATSATAAAAASSSLQEGCVIRPSYLVLSARNIDQRDEHSRFYSALVADTRLTPDFCSDVRILVFVGAERLDYVSLSRALKLFEDGGSLEKLIFLYDSATALTDAPVIDARQLCDARLAKHLYYGRVIRDLVCGGVVMQYECCPLDRAMRDPVVAALARLRGAPATLTTDDSVLQLSLYDASDLHVMQDKLAVELMLTRTPDAQLTAPDLFVVVGRKAPDSASTRLCHYPMVQELAALFEESATMYSRLEDSDYNLRQHSPVAEQFIRFARDQTSLFRIGDTVSWNDELPFSLLPIRTAPLPSDGAPRESTPRICASAGFYVIAAMYASRTAYHHATDDILIEDGLTCNDHARWLRRL